MNARRDALGAQGIQGTFQEDRVSGAGEEARLSVKKSASEDLRRRTWIE